MTLPGHSPYLTTREAADLLGVSLRTVQLWVENGTLEAWKTEGGHRRILREAIDRVRGTPYSPRAMSVVVPVRAPSAPLRVVAVDDDPVMLRLYKHHIAHWSLPVQLHCASNGYEALMFIGRDSPDLLVCDLAMPGIDGFQMMRALSGSTFREGMQIVVATGLDDASIAAQGGLPTDVSVLHKPVPFERLRAIAEALMSRRAALTTGAQ